MSSMPFSQIPILRLSQALDPATKPAFLQELRSALLNVGFLYLSETGLPDSLIKKCRYRMQSLLRDAAFGRKGGHRNEE